MAKKTDRIKVGDIVYVWWTETKEGTKAEVIHLPSGGGDTIQVRYFDNTVIELINPYCSQFVGLTKKIENFEPPEPPDPSPFPGKDK